MRLPLRELENINPEIFYDFPEIAKFWTYDKK